MEFLEGSIRHVMHQSRIVGGVVVLGKLCVHGTPLSVAEKPAISPVTDRSISERPILIGSHEGVEKAPVRHHAVMSVIL